MSALSSFEAQLSIRQRFRVARARARRLLGKKVDFIQDPDTGLLGGSYPQGGDQIAIKDKHPGEGYSEGSYVSNGVIHTDDVYDAVKALSEDRKVELKQPRQVSVLLDKLGEVTRSMILKGEKAPRFNLCNVTIKGTNLFCADTHGIPRIQMPQIPKERDQEFIQYLAEKGHKVEYKTESASYLRATQNELDGTSVANLAAFLRNKPGHQSNPIAVSKDNYILDGHHRWAAKIGLDAEDNILGDPDISIARVDIGITELLEEAEKFTGGKGKLGLGERTAKPGDNLTSRAIIKEAGEVKPNSRKVTSVAKELNDRAGAILKKDLGVESLTPSNRTDQTDAYLARVIAQELKDGLTNGHSAADWYDQSMREAMATANKLYPGVATDPDKRFMYTAALAITSQGEVVESSVRLADVAYKHFEKTGKFPEDIKAADPNVVINLKKVNAFIDEMGIAKTREMFDREMTVAELKELTGTTVSGMGVEDKVYGSAVLGPKIGNGFYQNLNGNFSPITMDLWFMRSWGRITNTGIRESDMSKLIARFDNALQAEGKSVPKTAKAKVALAREIFDKHEKDYKEHKADYKSGARKKTELVHSAERFVLNHDGAMIEMPRGVAHRRFITSVFHKAIQHLKDRDNITITPASAQATWWWPEKVLYDKLGVRVRELDMDYAKSLRKLADSRGIKRLSWEQGLGSVPWIDDPDEPDYMSDAEIKAMAARAAEKFKPRTKAYDAKKGDVDFIQDPETGRFQGSRPQGGDDKLSSDEKPGAAKPAATELPQTTDVDDFRPHTKHPAWPWKNEDDGTAKAGDDILVFRLGREGGGLPGKNGGNVNSVAIHVRRIDDVEAPGLATGDTITSYRVKLIKDTGEYTGVVAGKPTPGQSVDGDQVGRVVQRGENPTDLGPKDFVAASYSFPTSGAGYQYEVLDSVPIADVRAKLKLWGYANADAAGTLKTAEAIRASFNELAWKPQPHKVSGAELREATVSYHMPYERNRNAGKFENEAEFNRAESAIRSYQSVSPEGTPGHAYNVNAALRGQKEMTPDIQSAVDDLDFLFKKTAAVLSETNEKWLYRGIRPEGHELDDLKVGDELQDNAFVSTTHYKDYAKEWADKKGPGGIVAKVIIPAGLKTVPVAEQVGLVEQDEGEILLNRGTRFRITKVAGKNIEMTVIR